MGSRSIAGKWLDQNLDPDPSITFHVTTLSASAENVCDTTNCGRLPKLCNLPVLVHLVSDACVPTVIR